MKISQKLIGSFVGASLLTGLVGAVAIAQSHKIAQTLAIAEAEHVAQTLAISIVHDSYYDNRPISIDRAEELQDYINLLHTLQKRDVEVVDRQKLILADAIPNDIGTIFEDDQNNEVQQTIQDGITRTFIERSDDYPQGVKLIVVPLTTNLSKIDGAVILEWSSLYNEAIARSRPTMLIIGFTSLSCLVLALFIGFRISESIAKPLQSVTTVAQQVTQESNFDLQAPVTTQDETGTLAIALNDLIQRVKVLLAEKEQHSEELQQALIQLQSTQLQLVQTEKMSSLGQLVAGVAHEINNPINFIHGNVAHIDNYSQEFLKVIQAYQDHYPNPPRTLQTVLDEVELDFLSQDLIKLLQSMKVGTDRIREIVLSLRNFSRLDETGFKAVDIHEGINNTLVILHHRLKAKADHPEIIVIKEYGQLPHVECLAGQLNQVFMNILSNAIDAFEEWNQGKTFGEIASSPSTIRICTYQIDHQRVGISIIDNGPGIPKAIQSRLFDPFFTTKAVGKGTGLGLSISYQIVTEKHGGSLWCDSTPQRGTKFIIELPIKQKF